jgi:hypothetical protein
MKNLLCLLLITSGSIAAQPGGHFDPNYHFLQSGSAFQDKTFYFLTLLQKLPDINGAMRRDSVFERLFRAKTAELRELPATCGDSTGCYLAALSWTEADNRAIGKELAALLTGKPAFRVLLKHIRACGNFERYDSLTNEACIRQLWQDAADGMNYCLKAYLTNEGLLYPGIDSTHYPVADHYYRDLVHELVLIVQRRSATMGLFFEPALAIATELLRVNGRDEATRYDPDKINAIAYAKIPGTKWPHYPYSVILVLGEGPEDLTVPLSPHGKYRCQVAAALYKAGKAPFIIVSGGHVHPFQTPFAEAMEMQRYLVHELGIPAVAVIADPFARHTTTNLRNAARFVYRHGIPADKKIIGITGPSQVSYVLGQKFADRCYRDLGYLPFRKITAVDEFCFQGYPVQSSLQVNVLEPLDP